MRNDSSSRIFGPRGDSEAIWLSSRLFLQGVETNGKADTENHAFLNTLLNVS